jgi:hypothetical protein
MKSVIRYKGLPAQNNLTSSTEPELIGWLIYLPDTEEFFHSHQFTRCICINAYTKEPSLAFCFGSQQFAFCYSIFINKSTKIVSLYVCGNRFIVVY